MATIAKTFGVRNGLDVANTIVLDSNRYLSNIVGANVNTANATTVNATNFVTSVGLDVTGQANAARSQANTARDTANGAYAQANGAYAQANGAYAQANGAYAQANGAYDQANGAYAQANTSGNTVRVYANSAGELSNKFLNFVNTASIQVSVADSGDGNANITFTTTGAAVGDAYAQANAAYEQANSARDQANTGYGQANAAYNTANVKVASIAVSGNGLAVSNSTSANINGYTISVNVATTSERGTTLLIDSVSSSDTANAATANAVKTAWDYANTKLAITGGTINGSLNVSGNLAITGNTTYYNVTTYSVDDPLIYLAANNDTSDLVDIGFMGGHNTAGVYQHSGLARDAGDGTWYLFTGLQDEGHENNIVDFANTTLATLRSNIAANSITLMGNVVATAANTTAAYDQANAARGQANTAYGQANAAYAQANAAYGDANTRVLKAGDTMTGNLTVNAFINTNTVFVNKKTDLAAPNTSNFNGERLRLFDFDEAGHPNYAIGVEQSHIWMGVDSSAYNQGFKWYGNTALAMRLSGNGVLEVANTINAKSFVTVAGLNVTDQANTAYAQANAARGQANAAYDQANAAYADANTRVSKSGDTMTGNLTITVAGEGFKVANANVTNYLSVGSLNVTTNVVTTSTTGQVILDAFALTAHSSAKYFVQANSGLDFVTTEIIVLHDGTNIYLTEYGTIETGPSLGTFSADIDSGNARLLFTANNNVNTIRSVRYGVLVP
jgi:Phage tail fibre repeat